MSQETGSDNKCTLKLLGMELNLSVEYLICQFADIGIQKSGLDCVSQDEKEVLLTYMSRGCKNEESNVSKLTLQRKIHSTLNIFSSGGKSKKVQIEIRKKHTYVRCHPNVLRYAKEDNNGPTSYFNEKVNVSSCSVSEKNNSIVQTESLRKKSLFFLKKDVEMCDKKKKEEITFTHRNKERKEKEIMLRKHQSNQRKNLVNVSFFPKCKKKSTLSVSSIYSDNSSVEDDFRKKMNTDRRCRNRQRLRSSRSRSNKVNIHVKHKKNYDHFFDVSTYEFDASRPAMGGTKNQKCKYSVLTHAFNKPTQIINRDVLIGEVITVAELANKMAIKSSQVVKVMMQLGTMVTVDQVIDQQTAKLVAEEMGHRVILRRENDVENMVINDRNYSSGNTNVVSDVFESRPPVVAVMGHVDHGKTSLLDSIRSSNVVDSEEGGITQHIGAYCVEISNRKITFLDTPGHSAFTAMRIRGVKTTDIVVLVVAVDDGVMLQTIEAIQHVKVAKIPMIVALNKIDKVVDASTNIDRIKNNLSEQGIIPEEWGGETQFVSVSAKSKIGIDNLLNAILLESELLELKVSHDGMASGVVLESFLDKGKGPVATVLVKEGTLKCGDTILCGLEYGRVRAMRNELGHNVHRAGPSVPVEVFGLSAPPLAGDLMIVVRDERKAREVALYRKGKFRSMKLEKRKHNKIEDMLMNVDESGSTLLKLHVVLKADTQGSVGAICDVLNSFVSSNVQVNIVGFGVGGINETDVSLAIATCSMLLGFNVRVDILARRLVESENLNVRCYSVIYDLINDIKKLIDDKLVLKHKKVHIGLAEVRNVFCFPKLGNVAGCMMLEGIIRRYNKVNIFRNRIIVYEGELESLRRFRDDVNEVRAGMECGIVIKNYKDIRAGDFIEVVDSLDSRKRHTN